MANEKLIELLEESPYLECLFGYPDYEKAADHLIANGVTIQKQDGCDYCQEDAEGYRKMNGAFSIANPFHGSDWFIDTGHCKPRNIYFCPMCGRKLAEPPKGE